jgi:hypothetical protein
MSKSIVKKALELCKDEEIHSSNLSKSKALDFSFLLNI